MPNYNTLWGARDLAGMRGSVGGGLDPIGKSHVIWVDLDLNPLPPLAKFSGSAHGGGGQFISLECIRTDCLMRPSQGFWGTGEKGYLFQGKGNRGTNAKF